MKFFEKSHIKYTQTKTILSLNGYCYTTYISHVRG